MMSTPLSEKSDVFGLNSFECGLDRRTKYTACWTNVPRQPFGKSLTSLTPSLSGKNILNSLTLFVQSYSPPFLLNIV